jgi:hypothetical protein
MVASAANGTFLDAGADTAGLHRLAVFMLVVAALFLLVSLLDRTLGRIGRDTPTPETEPESHP